MLDSHPNHPGFKKRLKTATSLKNRLTAAASTGNPPSQADLLAAGLLCLAIEVTGDAVERSPLWPVYLSILTILPAAELALERAEGQEAA